MSASPIVLSLALLLAVPCAAMAQDEVVASNARSKTLPSEADIAKAKADAAKTAKPVVTKDMMIARLNEATPASDRAPVAYVDAGPSQEEGGKRQIHGGGGVSVGTGGYRSGYVYSLIPVGDNGTLGIAVSQTDYGKNRVPYYGYGYGYPDYGYSPYSYSPYGYGRGYGARGGRSQSLAVSYSHDETRESSSSTPDGCAPGFRDGDRYVEPLWVTRQHNDQSCTVTADKP